VRDFVKRVLIICSIGLAAGCAHPITISPPISELSAAVEDPIPATVGYYFTENKIKSVTTSGGGGDDVTYKPYEDLETSLYKTLSNVFERVEPLGARSEEVLTDTGIDYVMSVTISTSSSSSSALTWPPTDFEVSLSCDISNRAGDRVEGIFVIGEGQADWDEFKNDFALSAKRASKSALTQLQEKLLASDSFAAAVKLGKGEPTTVLIDDADDSGHRTELLELKRLFDEGLISSDVYQNRQRDLLDRK